MRRTRREGHPGTGEYSIGANSRRGCLPRRITDRTVSMTVGDTDRDHEGDPVTTESYSSNQPQPYGAQPPVYGHSQTVIVQSAPGNGLGVAGFVTGLLGLLFCWVPFLGVLLALLGVILGGVGIATGKKKGAPTGLAIAGLVLGIIALIPAIILISAVASIGAAV